MCWSLVAKPQGNGQQDLVEEVDRAKEEDSLQDYRENQ